MLFGQLQKGANGPPRLYSVFDPRCLGSLAVSDFGRRAAIEDKRCALGILKPRFRWKSKLPQWLKPSHLRGYVRAERACGKTLLYQGHGFSRAVKVLRGGGFSRSGTVFHGNFVQAKAWKSVPRGLKPSLLRLFTARLKPCPSYKAFSASSEARTLQRRLLGRL